MVRTSQVLGSCSTYKPLAISYRDEPSQAATTLYCPPRNDVQARAQVREYSTDISLLIVSTVQVYSQMQARAQERVHYSHTVDCMYCTSVQSDAGPGQVREYSTAILCTVSVQTDAGQGQIREYRTAILCTVSVHTEAGQGQIR